MPRHNIKRRSFEKKRYPLPGEYQCDYRKRHRYVTSTLTNEEHEALRTRAEEAGIAPTTLATKIVREFLTAPFDIDAWQDDGENYPADEREGV